MIDFSELYIHIRTWLLANPNALLFSIFFIAMIEAVAVIGVFIPAMPMLFVLTVLAAHADIGLVPLFIVGIIGAMMGDGISYLLGLRFQHRIETFWPFNRHPEWMERSEAFVKKHGGKSIIFGRFIGPLRCFVPIAAGVFKMPPLYFLWMNFLSALVWAPFHLLPGYSFGAAISHDWVPGKKQLIAVAVLASIIFIVHWLLISHEKIRAYLFTPKKTLQNQGWLFAIDGAPQNQRAALILAGITLSLFLLMCLPFPFIKTINSIITPEFFSLRQPAFDIPFIFFSLFGEKQSLFIFATPLLGWLILRKDWRLLGSMLAITVICLAVPEMIKSFFQQPRPDWLITPYPNYSFISGHAFSATLIWGSALLLLMQYKNQTAIHVLSPTLLMIIVFSAFSRPYLGAHWFFDVIAGVVLALFFLAILRWYSYRNPAPKLSLAEFITLLIIGMALAIFLYVAPHFSNSVQDYIPKPSLLNGYF